MLHATLRRALFAFLLALFVLGPVPAQEAQAQTQLVADLEPGSSSASYGSFTYSGATIAGGKLYFAASVDPYNEELWVTDGTEAGTHLVKDISSGTAYPENLTAFEGKLYFTTVNSDDHGSEVWLTDGTSGGTHVLKEIGNPEGEAGISSDPDDLVVFDGKLFFSADNWQKVDGDWRTENELWVSDGTAAGTHILDLNPGTFEDWSGRQGYFDNLRESNPGNLMVAGDQLFFTAQDEHGEELWVSDGTLDGTHMVKDIYPGLNEYDNPNTSNPGNLTAYDGNVFFIAEDSVNGWSLWKSDGTPEGTVIVKASLGSGYSGGSFSNDLHVYDGKLYFTDERDGDWPELWVTDGTTASTQLVKTMPAVSGRNPSLIILDDAGGELFLRYRGDWLAGGYLWVTDGTEAGTQEVEYFDSGVSMLAAYEDRLYFAGRKKHYSGYPNYTTKGNELWVSDGTPEGTMLVKDIYPGGYDNNSAPENESDPEGGVVYDGRLYFTAEDGTHGRELWATDGAPIRRVELDPADLSPIEIPELNFRIDFASLDQQAVLEVLRNAGAVTETLDLPAGQGLALAGTWRLDLDQTPAFAADVCFDLENVINDVDPSLLNVYKREADGQPWQGPLSTELRPSSSPQRICATGVTGFSEFAVTAEQGALPVELAGFEAAPASGGTVALTWQTFSETGNDRFRIERRADEGAAWTKVGTRKTQASGGTSSEALRYRFEDTNLPFEATALTYRLIQRDLDGDETTVGEKTIEVGAPRSFTLHGNFPNPVRSRTTIRYELPEKRRVTLTVYDVLGRTVRTLVDEEQAGRQEIPFAAGGLSSGTYFYRLTAGDYTQTRKLVLVR